MDVDRPADPADAQDAQLTYVMIRVRRQSGEFGRWTGMAEHLGTAEKRSFLDGSGLLRLIEEWSAGPSADPATVDRTRSGPARPPDWSAIGDGRSRA